MCTTSTATALAACNHIPGNETELLNWMCVLVLTRGDDTPFDATSIQEEDIIELCVEMGQTHLPCVLWFLATESVILFHSGNEMLAMACRVIKAMVLCEEPIRLHTSSSSAAHLRAYIAVRDGWPSGAQSLIQIGRRFTNHPLVTPTLMGGPHTNFTWTLGMPN